MGSRFSSYSVVPQHTWCLENTIKQFLQIKNSPTAVNTLKLRNLRTVFSLVHCWTLNIFDFWNWTDNYAQHVQKILLHFEAKDNFTSTLSHRKIYSIWYWLVSKNYSFIDNQRYFFSMIGHSGFLFGLGIFCNDF